MIGVKQGSAIGTLVERKTRFTYILKLANKKSNTVTTAFSKALNTLDENWRKTLTYDNGVEMAYHQKLTAKTGSEGTSSTDFPAFCKVSTATISL